MPIVVKCGSCGFVFYQGRELKNIYDVLKQWGFRCPCCMSIIEPEQIINYEIKPSEKALKILQSNKGKIELIVSKLIERACIRTVSETLTCSRCGNEIRKGMLYIYSGGKPICENCLRNIFSNEVIDRVKEIKLGIPKIDY